MTFSHLIRNHPSVLDIGAGWMPTILSDEQELNFVMENQRGLRNSQSFWIGRAINVSEHIDFPNHIPYQDAVFASTQETINNDFQLSPGNDALLLHGVLCENGWYLA